MFICLRFTTRNNGIQLQHQKGQRVIKERPNYYLVVLLKAKIGNSSIAVSAASYNGYNILHLIFGYSP